MKKRNISLLFLAVSVLSLCFSAETATAQRVKKAEYSGQELNNQVIKKMTWTTVTIDKRFEASDSDNLKTPAVIAKYKPEVDKYMEPIGYCPNGLLRGYPVAPLSNWASDAYLEYAQNYIDTTSRTDIDKNIKIDFSLMNFGGIRTEMPKGNVSKYDILSIFPFDNFLVIEELDGDKVQMLMEFFAKTRGQVMSNVKPRTEGGEVKECLIGGQPLDPSRKYVVATIDFLYNGGDNVYPLKYSNWVIETDKKLMNVFIEYIQSLTRQGKNIEAAIDDRLITDGRK